MRWYPHDHWQKWYAWYPVITESNVTAWLETVWRSHNGVHYKYRLREEYSDIEPQV